MRTPEIRIPSVDLNQAYQKAVKTGTDVVSDGAAVVGGFRKGAKEGLAVTRAVAMKYDRENDGGPVQGAFRNGMMSAVNFTNAVTGPITGVLTVASGAAVRLYGHLANSDVAKEDGTKLMVSGAVSFVPIVGSAINLTMGIVDAAHTANHALPGGSRAIQDAQ